MRWDRFLLVAVQSQPSSNCWAATSALDQGYSPRVRHIQWYWFVPFRGISRMAFVAYYAWQRQTSIGQRLAFLRYNFVYQSQHQLAPATDAE